jgi:hypothetical protein
MAMPVVQCADGAIVFLAGAGLTTSGEAFNDSFITLVPARTAVRVIAFSVRWTVPLQTDFRLRLAIHCLSDVFDS